MPSNKENRTLTDPCPKQQPGEPTPFKTGMRPNRRLSSTQGPPFSWLEGRPSHEIHMGLQRASAMPADLARLETACARLELVLPSDFLLFMQTAQMWGQFRSVNGGYFDIRKDPARCPISDGFLVPFISDQQYCHFYFLHIAPGRSNHEIVWADDLYLGALYATSEEFEREYRQEFDPSDIYLRDGDFENFMHCHLQDHEKWFESRDGNEL